MLSFIPILYSTNQAEAEQDIAANVYFAATNKFLSLSIPLSNIFNAHSKNLMQPQLDGLCDTAYLSKLACINARYFYSGGHVNPASIIYSIV